MRNILAIVASGAMLFSSAAASAAGISRTSAPIGEQEEIAGNPWIPWVVALIAALVIVFVVTDDDGEPESP